MMAVWGLVFLTGLAVGSFLNVIVYRVLHGDSPLKGRSKCPKCRRQLRWYDNVPLLSFGLLRGRCRFCGARISWHYPVLEFLTGLLFVWWYGVGQFFFRLTQQPYRTIQPMFWLAVGAMLISLAVSDFFFGVLPDVFTVGLGVGALVYRFILTVAGVMELKDFVLAIGAAAGSGALFVGLWRVTQGKGMGVGDVKLAVAMGFLLGWPKILVAMAAAFLTGAGVGLILIAIGKKRFRQTIPFGPFLVLGTAIALMWGGEIWERWMRMIGI